MATETVNATVEQVCEHILQQSKAQRRYTVAIAGPPAAGKTTLTKQLAETLAKTTSVAVVAMDGFHLDNAILKVRDRLDCKGAPDTFDVSGLRALLARLAQQDEEIAVAVFDRNLDLSRAAADIVSPQDHIVLVEGNYLLLDEPPWNCLASYFNLRVLVDAPMKTLQDRLVRRWLDHKHSRDEAMRRASSNDLPNAKYVLEHTTDWDLRL